MSVLTGIFGADRLQLAEDVVQEAMARALQTWPYYGVPKNPAAWLTLTAKNLALDVIRREKLFHEKQPQVITYMEQWAGEVAVEDSPSFETEIKDGRLRLIFTCCHPALPQESQTALALKTLCGFSPAEIATAFLTTEAAIAKRLTRARQRIQELKIRFEIPSGDELPARLDAVLQTLYLLFNEGYKASSGESLIRDELCKEAIRLTAALAEHPASRQPRVNALLALMLLNGARFKSRMDSDGNILRLKDQNRANWDSRMIGMGMFHLAQSAAGKEISAYHMQAAISACHCTAASYEATDWRQILALYDRLVEIEDSPITRLNRAVALAEVEGPQAAIESMKAIQESALSSYYLYYAVVGEFEARLGNFEAATRHLSHALKLTEIKSEQQLLLKRMAECREKSGEEESVFAAGERSAS